MTDRTIRFTVRADLAAETDSVAAELGITIEELASAALEAYLAGKREACRSIEKDNVTRLPSASASSHVLMGDEEWLSTID